MAVDTETLEVLAEQGITFTILCPHQVHLPDNGWADSIRYYETRLPLNRRIALFLRDEELSNRIAFDQATTPTACTSSPLMARPSVTTSLAASTFFTICYPPRPRKRAIR